MPSSISSRFLRRGLLAVLLIGLLGTAAELVLLVHYEDLSQMIPLALMAVAAAALALVSAVPGPASARLLKVIMAGFVVAGVAGVVLHVQANAEFQREIDPAITGVDLFWKVAQAKAPPALAPGVMVQLGLIGWLYAWLRENRDR